MKAFPLFVFLILAFGAHVSASAEQTGIAYGGVKQFKMESRATATDANGNHYLVGTYEDYSGKGIDFDPGSDTDLRFTLPGHSADVFLTKLNADGSYGWTRTWGGENNDYAASVAVDAAGNVYVAGHFYKTVDFDPGLGTDTRTSAGQHDLFISKFTTSGDRVWTRTWGGTGSDVHIGVVIDALGVLHVTGYFNATVDFDPGSGTKYLTAPNSSTPGSWNPDVFVASFSLTGDFINAISFGGSGSDRPLSFAVDSNSNLYVGGRFYGTADFDPSPAVEAHSSNGDADAFITKFDPALNHLWTKTWGGIGEFDEVKGIAVDQAGNVYAAGNFEETVDFDPSGGENIVEAKPRSEGYGTDIYLSKFSSAGSYLWTKTWGSSEDEYIKSIALTSEGWLYLGGTFGGSIDFDPGAGTKVLTANGKFDAFVSAYDTSGNFLAALSFGGSANGWGNDEIDSLEALPEGELRVLGRFRTYGDERQDFDFGPREDLRVSQDGHSILLTVLPSYKLGGVVRLGTAPLSGVTVNGFEVGSTVTAADGSYSLTGMLKGQGFTLIPSRYGYYFEPANVSSSFYPGASENFTAYVDLCPDDSEKVSPGVCGCGTPDSDLNGDNIPDCRNPKVSTIKPPKPRLSQKRGKVTVKLGKHTGLRYLVSYRFLTGKKAVDRKLKLKTLKRSSSTFNLSAKRTIKLSGKRYNIRTIELRYKYILPGITVLSSPESKRVKLKLKS